MASSFKKVNDTVTKKLEDMTKSFNDTTQFMKKAVIPMYANAMRKKFATENKSEGEAWLPLNAKYAAQKRTKFSSFPGGGTKMLIATGNLFQSLFPGGDKNRTVVDKKTLAIATEIDYARHVDKIRPIMKFRNLAKEIKEKYVEYIATGLINGRT